MADGIGKWALGLRVAWKIGSGFNELHFMRHAARATGRKRTHGWRE